MVVSSLYTPPVSLHRPCDTLAKASGADAEGGSEPDAWEQEPSAAQPRDFAQNWLIARYGIRPALAGIVAELAGLGGRP